MMGGRSSVVEFQPSKLAVVGSNPIARSRRREALFVIREAPRTLMQSGKFVLRLTNCGSRLTKNAHVAQLVEHVLGKDEVTRSIRVVGSRLDSLDPHAHESVSARG